MRLRHEGKPPAASPGAMATARLPRLPRGWPTGRPRILVADSWLANGGDGAISIATHRRLRQLAPDAAILHAAYQADLVQAFYPELDFAPPLASLTGQLPDLPEARGWRLEELLGLLEGADVVLSQGGGFLIERYEPWQRLDAYERVLELGLPLGFVGQTIGRFNQPARRASLARALLGARVVGVRDRHSRRNVTELGVAASDVRLGADEAFGLFAEPPAPLRRRGVACVVSSHALIGEGELTGDQPRLAEALAEAVTRIAEAVAPEPVTVLSTTQGLGGLGRGLEDDAALARDVLRLVDDRHAVRHVDGYIDPLRCATLIGEHRVLVSMRMHPVIFAMSQGVPSVAVTRAHKAEDMLRDLELEGETRVWLDPRAIAAAVARALEGQALAGLDLWERLGTLRQRARQNDELLADLLASAVLR